MLTAPPRGLKPGRIERACRLIEEQDIRLGGAQKGRGFGEILGGEYKETGLLKHVLDDLPGGPAILDNQEIGFGEEHNLLRDRPDQDSTEA